MPGAGTRCGRAASRGSARNGQKRGKPREAGLTIRRCRTKGKRGGKPRVAELTLRFEWLLEEAARTAARRDWSRMGLPGEQVAYGLIVASYRRQMGASPHPIHSRLAARCEFLSSCLAASCHPRRCLTGLTNRDAASGSRSAGPTPSLPIHRVPGGCALRACPWLRALTVSCALFD